jgi:hypothetical protein
MDSARSPRSLTLFWVVLLLAPVAWATALGVMFSLTDESCRRHSITAIASVGIVCVMMTAAPAPLAWHLRRGIDLASPGGGRARFLLEVAVGASLIFTLVTLMSAIPVFLLDPCRT